MPSSRPTHASRRWALVLAGGDGTRLAGLTSAGGQAVPKQFCSFCSQRSLLGETLVRARRHVPDERIVTVVAEKHRPWWERDLADLPPENVVSQPLNRGTAAGLLTGVLRVTHRDPEARLLVMPSDHWVRDEDVLQRALEASLGEVERWLDHVILLGVTPEEPDTGYGWIVPGDAPGGVTAPVRTFVEKPERPLAESLMHAGALWNSFLMSARASVLLELYERTLPWMTWVFRLGPRGARREEAWYRDIYAGLPIKDVSRDILERCTDRLRVARAPCMGWSDLGTPERLARLLARVPAARAAASTPDAPAGTARAAAPAPVSLDDAVLHAAPS